MSDLKDRDKGLIKNWYIICLSSELKTGPIERTIYDNSYVLFRDENAQAVCMVNRCLHRLTTLHEGRVEKGKIICPYHGWTYDKNGKVVDIPSEGPHFKDNNLCLKPLPLQEQDGVIWVWVADTEPEPASPPWRFPKSDEPGWSSYFMVTDFENEVTNLCENFMDVPHTVFVHKGWFRNKSQKEVPMTVQTSNARVLVTYDQAQDRIGGMFHKILNPEGAPMIHTDEFIYPNITRVDYLFGNYGFIINSQNTPVSTLKSRTYTYIAYKVKIPNQLIKPLMRFYTRSVINQDVEIMRIQAESLRIDPRENFRSTDADAVHVAIERIRQFGRVSSEKLYSFSQTVKKSFWF